MRIDQLIPAYHRGDAIGDTASHMKSFFLEQGFESRIYCLSRDEELETESSLFESFPKPSPEDITILHFALPSPLTQAFCDLPSHRVMIYHNITPHEFFSEYSPELAGISKKGREELESLISHVSLVLADSEYNRQETLALGYQKAEVLPLFIDFEKYLKTPNPFLYDFFCDDRTNILFVGRIAPNKKIEDLIKVAFYFKKYISPLVRLIIVGKTSTIPKYYENVVRLADEFYLKPEEICFTGHIPDEDMFALYQASDVFLSMSEHEGFGLPFIEAMMFDLPIVAYDCTAVPSTLEEAGVLFKDKNVPGVSELIKTLTSDESLKERIIAGQQKRLNKFKSFKREQFLLRIIKEFTE